MYSVIYIIYYRSMSDVFCTIDANRKNGLLFNVPPVRFTPISPYELNPSLTQYQLDMRRKVEILKYKKNTVGSMTKKQVFAQAIKGATQRRNFSQTQIAALQNGEGPVSQCPPTISTAAGVPGPAFYLSLDPNIPLYNYTVSRTYATENKEDEVTKWIYVEGYDIAGNDIKLATMNIRKPIDQSVYIYTFETSVGIQINGARGPLTAVAPLFSTKLIPDDINIVVKYGGQPITLMTTPLVTLSPGFLTEISGNVISTGGFSGNIYMGNMTVSNLALMTSPGYTYDICIKYIPSNTFTNIVSYTSTMISGVQTSFTNSVKKNESGLQFFTTVPASSIVPFSLSGL
jgi:hypothetical protein